MIPTTKIPRGRIVDRSRAAAIAIERGQLLLIRRKRTGQAPYYVLPGGGIEPNERPAAALRRELREETGLTVSVVRKVFIERTARNNRQYYFLVRAPFRPVALPRSAEEQSAERIRARGTSRPVWLPLQRLPQIRLMPPSVALALRAALTHGFPIKPHDLTRRTQP